MKLFLLHAFCLLYIPSAFSQSPKKWQAKQDTSYINILASKWSVRFHTISKYNQFTYSGAGFASSYKPDVKIALGIGASYKNLAIDLGWNLFSSDPSHKSKNLALLSSMYLGANVLEITAQEYQRYTVRISNKNNEQLVEQFRPDINTFNLGLNYNYNFNHRKFSFDAASIGTQIQKRSAGTPLAGAFLSYFNMSADSAIISSPYANPDEMITHASLFTGGISAGYAYVFVLPSHFYVMLSLTPKLALNGGDTKTTMDQPVHVNLTPGFITRNAIGYSGNKYYGLLSVLVDYYAINTTQFNGLSYDPTKVKLLIGYRFD